MHGEGTYLPIYTQTSRLTDQLSRESQLGENGGGGGICSKSFVKGKKGELLQVNGGKYLNIKLGNFETIVIKFIKG